MSYPRVQQYLAEIYRNCRSNGYVETLAGRRRYLPAIKSNDPKKAAAARRQAINSTVQGSAADIIKAAMIKVHALLRERFPQSKLILQVHDELVLEVPTEQLDAVRVAVEDAMTNVVNLKVPLIVESGDGDTWDAAH